MGIRTQYYIFVKYIADFNMAEVFAGTGFNQIVEFTSNDRHNNKIIYGNLARSPVRSITLDADNQRIIYANSKSIYAAYQTQQIEELVTLRQHSNILDVEYFHPNAFRYCLSDGSIYIKGCAPTGEEAQTSSEQILQFIGQKHSKFNTVSATSNRERYLFAGYGVVPIVCDLAVGNLHWYGKNVKNDELDLEVPIKDVDAQFIRDDKFLAILNADRKLRIYDIRGTHRRPIQDVVLQSPAKSQMTKMKVSNSEHEYFFSNDIGEIYKCDSRKDWKTLGKYKGITSTVTDFQISNACNVLAATSLDSYVRLYELDTCKLIKKIYINKPAYCIQVLFNEEEEKCESSQDGEEVELNLDLEDEEPEPKRVEKLKQIRKRNKVGLKYLEPREFDQPEIKQQQVQKQEWYEGLNPIDRKDFEE